MQLEIERLEDLTQDLFEWTDTFRTAAETCGWDENASKQILRSVIAPCLIKATGNAQNTEEILMRLMKLKYPKEQKGMFHNQLKKIKQENYVRIAEYEKAIQEMVGVVAIACDWGKGEKERRIEEQFFSGMGEATSREMDLLGLTTMPQILDRLSKIEEKLVEQTREKKDEKGSRQERTFQASQSAGKKWCSYHQSATHDNSECFTRKHREAHRTTRGSKPAQVTKDNQSSQAKPKEQTTGTNHYFEIPDEEPFQFEGKMANLKLQWVFDSGASGSFLSHEVAKQAKLQIHPIKLERRVRLGSGTFMEVVGYSQITVEFDQLPGIQWKVQIQIVESTLQCGILGLDFLRQHRCKADHVNRQVSLGELRMYEDHEKGKKIGERIDLLEERTGEVFTMMNTDETDPITESRALIKELAKEDPHKGHITEVTMSIDLKETPQKKVREYPVPLAQQDAVKEEIQRLLRERIIKPSNSSFASPAFLIGKKEGGIRLVVDYRELNRCTLKQVFPFPNIQDQMRNLKESSYFSKIDLQQGYYQIEMEEKSKELTAFMINGEQYQFLRMPFGLTNAPRTFQRGMNKLLGDLPYVKIFLDDILVSSTSENIHAQHLIEVLKRLRKAKAQINFRKSSFYERRVTYLGHIIDQEGMRPDISRVNTFKQIQPPKTPKQLQHIIGFINWFRPYIRNLNILLAPITEKLKGKKGGITWSNEDQSALNRIIKEIESQTLLSYPDITKEFTLETDASDIGIGAVLTQGKKIIGLYSCKLLPAETRYTTAEKEFLGIIKALKHFRTIIFNVHVKIKTDHANLLFNTSVENNRVQRWKLLLEEFDYELIYQKGEENIGADGLSRICFVHLSKKGERGHRELIDLDTLKTQQESSGWHKPPNCRRDNSLGLWTDTKSRIMIPPEYANKFLSNLHRKLGHLGEKNLYMTLRDIYQIKNIRGKIQKTVRSCLRCQMGKNGSTNRGRIVGNLATDVPFRDISMDIYGPIPSDIFKLSKAEEEISKLYFLTITDRCSRFSEVYWLRTLKSEEITRILRDEWCKRHPTPTTVLTDNGRQFTSQEFAAWITTQGITHKLTCPYNPTANSLSERINQTLTKVLICEKGKDLKSILRKINWGLQQAHNRAIGGIPAVLGGVEDQIDVLKIRPPIEEEARRMHVKRQEEAETAKKNAKRKTDYQYKLGQEVKWKQPRNQKTDDFFIGPLG